MAQETTTQEQTLPTVSPIDPNIGANSSAAYKALQDAIPPEVKITASPYSTGSDVTPTLPQAHQRQMQNTETRPFDDSLSERNHARNRNTWASVSNTITQFRNKQEQDKNAALTTSIATVMKAQQQIDNATAVLKSPTASDQDKQMAQGVIDQNKKVIEGKLTDPKSGKSILKAFDVSMTDPESQKTPEHQAAKTAAKQVAVATKAGLTADTPAEKAIQDKVTGADTPAQVQKAQATAQQTQTAKNPSATPYADKFLGSQPASITGNPEYAAQMAQKEKRDQLVTQYVIPKMIQAQMDQDKVMIQQEGLNNRAEFAGTIGLQKQGMALANAANIANAKDTTELRKQAMANSAAMARTVYRVQAMLKVADDKKLDPESQAKVKTGISTLVDKQVTDSLTQLKSIQDAIADNKYGSSPPSGHKTGESIDPAKDQALQTALSIQQLAVEQAQDVKQKTMTQLWGTPVINPNDPNKNAATDPYTKGTDGRANEGRPAAANTPSLDPKYLQQLNPNDPDSPDDGSTKEDTETERELIDTIVYQ